MTTRDTPEADGPKVTGHEFDGWLEKRRAARDDSRLRRAAHPEYLVPSRPHRPMVRNADLAIWTTCLDCGRPACWVATGWDARPPEGEPVHTGYWRHARKVVS